MTPSSALPFWRFFFNIRFWVVSRGGAHRRETCGSANTMTTNLIYSDVELVRSKHVGRRFMSIAAAHLCTVSSPARRASNRCGQAAIGHEARARAERLGRPSIRARPSRGAPTPPSGEAALRSTRPSIQEKRLLGECPGLPATSAPSSL